MKFFYLLIFSKVYAVPPIATGPKTATVTGWFKSEKSSQDISADNKLTDKPGFSVTIK